MANTSLIGLTLPATGTLSGQWGDTVNNAISQIVDVAVAGTQTISTDADITLTLTTGTYASTGLTANSSQYAVILWTAGGTATRTITVPAQSKTYVVINKTSSTQSIIVQGTTGTGVTVVAGTRAIIAWDGVNFVNVGGGSAGGSNTQVQYNNAGAFGGITGATTNGTALTLVAPVLGTPASGVATNLTGLPLTTGVTGTLPVANGGTGSATLTANNVILGNGTSAVQVVAPSTSGNVLTSNGTTWQSTAPAAGVSLSANNTWTGTQTFNGLSSIFGTSLLTSNETVNVVAAAPSATTNFYVQSGSVQYYTTSAANNWTLNIAFSSGTSMNTALATGQSVTFTLITTQGATAYYNNAVTIDGTSVTPKWIGGAPTAGNASGLDVYRFAVVKVGSASYTVLASLTQYK